MNRLDIINILAKKNEAQSYLELGVFRGEVFDHVKVSNKVGVDPDRKSKATLFLTSDDFFAYNGQKFDIIFIDGLHYSEQVEKDIDNSLNILKPNGFIICHDMLPYSENMQKIPRITKAWTGDCWKAWVKIRSFRKDLFMFVVDTDYGCGIIQKGSQQVIDISNIELTYNNFILHKNSWMNIISINTFKSQYENYV